MRASRSPPGGTATRWRSGCVPAALIPRPRPARSGTWRWMPPRSWRRSWSAGSPTRTGSSPPCGARSPAPRPAGGAACARSVRWWPSSAPRAGPTPRFVSKSCGTTSAARCPSRCSARIPSRPSPRGTRPRSSACAASIRGSSRRRATPSRRSTIGRVRSRCSSGRPRPSTPRPLCIARPSDATARTSIRSSRTLRSGSTGSGPTASSCARTPRSWRSSATRPTSTSATTSASSTSIAPGSRTCSGASYAARRCADTKRVSDARTGRRGPC
jgi:hypothetical protein